jgi:hypothetical protein
MAATDTNTPLARVLAMDNDTTLLAGVYLFNSVNDGYDAADAEG